MRYQVENPLTGETYKFNDYDAALNCAIDIEKSTKVATKVTDLAATDLKPSQTSTNPPKQPAKPNADEVLDRFEQHTFLIHRDASKTLEGQSAYRTNGKQEAKQTMKNDLISMLPAKLVGNGEITESEQNAWFYNNAIDQATEAIRAYFGVNGEDN